MTTSIGTVTAALVADLDNALTLTQVLDGPSGVVTTTLQRILTVGARVYDGSAVDDSLDGSTQAEQYTIELVNSVSIPGGGSESLDTACDWVLDDYANAKQYIRDHPELGLLTARVLRVYPAGDFELLKRVDENGRHAAVRWGVRVYAQVI